MGIYPEHQMCILCYMQWFPVLTFNLTFSKHDFRNDNIPFVTGSHIRCIPSTGAFSGIEGCTPSIANQWATTAVSSGALGKGVSITYTKKQDSERKSIQTHKEKKKICKDKRITYLLKFNIFVINIEQILVPSSSLETWFIFRSKSI